MYLCDAAATLALAKTLSVMTFFSVYTHAIHDMKVRMRPLSLSHVAAVTAAPLRAFCSGAIRKAAKASSSASMEGEIPETSWRLAA